MRNEHDEASNLATKESEQTPGPIRYRINLHQNGQCYSSFEHLKLGNLGFEGFYKVSKTVCPLLQKVMNGRRLLNASGTVLAFPENVKTSSKLQPGHIVALAGDFYGPESYQEVICLDRTPSEINTQHERFQAAYQKLASVGQGDQETELTELCKCFNIEQKNVDAAIDEGRPAHEGMQRSGVPGHAEYARITKYYKRLPDVLQRLVGNRYNNLLRHNHDHFGLDALTAFKAGYKVALMSAAQAAQANAANNESFAAQTLLRACTQMLFACHYLTDYFASGHIRTPRRKLRDILKRTRSKLPDIVNDGIAGLLSHEMHDEDGDHGLKLESDIHEEVWAAKGDSCLFDVEAQDNIEIIVAAVTSALMDIEHKFNGDEKLEDRDEKRKKSDYLNHIPRVKRGANHIPLFIISKDQKGEEIIMERKALRYENIKNIKDAESLNVAEHYQKMSSPELTLAKLSVFRAMKKLPKLPTSQEIQNRTQETEQKIINDMQVAHETGELDFSCF